MSLKKSCAVFLDRDDTLIACNGVTLHGDLGDPALVELLPGVAEACSMLKRAGFRLVVISNQGGVARGRFGTDAVERVNAKVNELLGGAIDAFRYCPFHPNGVVPSFTREHPWRKPAPGMILDAAAALDIELRRSWTVGDAARDVIAGKQAGTRTILIAPAEPGASDADFTVASLLDAATIILRESEP